MHYDIFRRITRIQTVLLHSMLQVRIPHITVYYICSPILITFVTLLHVITPQGPIEAEFIREESHFIAI